MNSSFCPTSRTFYRVRSVLMSELGLGRHDIWPSQELEELVPINKRQEVWRRLRREGLGLPPLTVSRRLRWASIAHVAHLALEFGAWCQNVLGLLVMVPLGLIVYAATRRWAVYVNRRGPLTVRDAVFYLTRFQGGLRARYGLGRLGEEIRAGYRPSRKEIEVRVRLIVAAHLGIPLERVTPETRFIEMFD